MINLVLNFQILIKEKNVYTFRTQNNLHIFNFVNFNTILNCPNLVTNMKIRIIKPGDNIACVLMEVFFFNSYYLQDLL